MQHATCVRVDVRLYASFSVQSEDMAWLRRGRKAVRAWSSVAQTHRASACKRLISSEARKLKETCNMQLVCVWMCDCMLASACIQSTSGCGDAPRTVRRGNPLSICMQATHKQRSTHIERDKLHATSVRVVCGCMPATACNERG
jgi:hypothetical protein